MKPRPSLTLKPKPSLETAGHEVADFGAHEWVTGDDYPDFVVPLAMAGAEELGHPGPGHLRPAESGRGVFLRERRNTWNLE